MPIVILFLLILFGVPIFIVIYIYNRLISLRNRVDESYSQIDVLLTKRADLIPNLVETVKGYAKHEKSVLENVTASRASLLSAKEPGDKFKASEMISSALKSLFAVVENYPDLKADSNFRDLQSQLSQIETEIAQTRMFYNQKVRDYNILQETFPANLFAQTFNHSRRQFYEIISEKKEPPIVSF
jgi:LemA protein